MPIAVVSTTYGLVDHHELVETLTDALRTAFPAADKLPASLALSEYGGRMRLRVTLPSDHAGHDRLGHRGGWRL